MQIINDNFTNFEDAHAIHEINMDDLCRIMGENYEMLKKDYIKEYQNNSIDKSVINDLFFDSTINPEKNQLNNIKISIIYNLCADYAHKQGDITNAWRLLASACHYGGMIPPIIQLYLARLENSSETKISKTKKTSATIRSEKYKGIKKEVIELITSHRPQGGWRDKRQAEAKISIILSNMIKDGKIISPNGKVPNIYNWLINDAEIKSTYETNSKSNIVKINTKQSQ